MSSIYELDGNRISTMEDFFAEVDRVLMPNVEWGRNLDALNDILRGGFATPKLGFTILWKEHARSRARLGYPETVRQLERRLGKCHPSNRPAVEKQLEQARLGVGPTVFDWLVEIVRDHGTGGTQEQDHVALALE